MLLAVLERAGVALDNASLMAAARAHEDATVRWVAIDLLGQQHALEARELLLGILRADEDRLIRETAALALARLGEAAGLSALEEFMRAPADAKSQLFLAARLAELGRGTGYEYVVDVLVDPEPNPLKPLAADTLSSFYDLPDLGVEPEQQPGSLLLALTEDPDAAVRSAALTQLSIAVNRGMALASALPRVERVAHSDPDAKLRQQANLLLDAWQSEGRLSGDRHEGPR